MPQGPGRAVFAALSVDPLVTAEPCAPHAKTAAQPDKSIRRPRLLPSKLVPPVETQLDVQRVVLVERMGGRTTAGAAGKRPRLTLVHAPAGFGKTTLLLQGYAAARRQHCDTAWLTLDAADNDVDRLTTHLEASLPRIGGRRPSTGTHRNIASSMKIAPRTRPLVVFIDEFEVLHSPTALQLVQQMVMGLAAGCHVVIGSRGTPELGLGRLRTHGVLLQLGAEDLRFTLDETRSLLRDKHALEIADDELAALQQRTEGWPAAIQLAALSIVNHRDRAGFIASFTGSHSALAEYLAEDILARLDATVQSFLLETSVLPQFCAALCDAVRQGQDSGAILEQLERANLFILPLDLNRCWYRYHSLFAGFLRYRLERAQPGRLAELHRRAAAWFLAENRFVPAINHLVAGQAHAEAATLIARHADELLAQGRVRLLARWLQKLPDDELGRFPRLRLVEAWTLVLNRRYPQAMHCVSAIVARDSEAFACEAQTIRCLALSMSDRLDESLDAAEKHIAQLPADDVFQYGVLANILAYGMIARHRYDDARQLLSSALQRHALSEASFSRAVADYLESAIDLVQGRLGHVLTRLRPLAFGASGGERAGARQAGHGRATVSVLLASALFDSGLLGEAQRLLAESLPYMKENGAPDALVVSHTLSARVATIAGDRELATRHLADLEEIGRDVAMPRVIAAAWLERAWQHWHAGEGAAAQQALDRATLAYSTVAGGVSAAKDNASMFMTDIDLPALMAARLMSCRGESTAAIALLQPLLAEALAAQRHRRALRIRLLLALAQHAAGQAADAVQAFGVILRGAAHESPLRAFVDEGPVMGALLTAWLDSADATAPGVPLRFVGALQHAFGSTARAPRPPAPADALTRRELDVLRLLADGLRNADIAARLFVSETTVKAHLRNINTKLQASSRTNAVAIARQHGFLA